MGIALRTIVLFALGEGIQLLLDVRREQDAAAAHAELAGAVVDPRENRASIKRSAIRSQPSAERIRALAKIGGDPLKRDPTDPRSYENGPLFGLTADG